MSRKNTVLRVVRWVVAGARLEGSQYIVLYYDTVITTSVYELVSARDDTLGARKTWKHCKLP